MEDKAQTLQEMLEDATAFYDDAYNQKFSLKHREQCRLAAIEMLARVHGALDVLGLSMLIALGGMEDNLREKVGFKRAKRTA
jgi:hypothetical protein